MWSADAAVRQTPVVQPQASIITVDDDDDDDNESSIQQQVLDSLVSEFLQIVNCASRQTAVQYITDNQMDLEQAICAYVDNQTS